MPFTEHFLHFFLTGTIPKKRKSMDSVKPSSSPSPALSPHQVRWQWTVTLKLMSVVVASQLAVAWAVKGSSIYQLGSSIPPSPWRRPACTSWSRRIPYHSLKLTSTFASACISEFTLSGALSHYTSQTSSCDQINHSSSSPLGLSFSRHMIVSWGTLHECGHKQMTVTSSTLWPLNMYLQFHATSSQNLQIWLCYYI